MPGAKGKAIPTPKPVKRHDRRPSRAAAAAARTSVRPPSYTGGTVRLAGRRRRQLHQPVLPLRPLRHRHRGRLRLARPRRRQRHRDLRRLEEQRRRLPGLDRPRLRAVHDVQPHVGRPVGRGQHVGRGQQVGRVGQSGNATRPAPPLRGLARARLERRHAGQPARRTSRPIPQRPPAEAGEPRARMPAMFLDRVKIWVRAGDGGDGAATFRQRGARPARRTRRRRRRSGRLGLPPRSMPARPPCATSRYKRHFKATPGGRGDAGAPPRQGRRRPDPRRPARHRRLRRRDRRARRGPRRRRPAGDGRARRPRRARQHPLQDRHAPGAQARPEGRARRRSAGCGWSSGSSPTSGWSGCRTPASRRSSRPSPRHSRRSPTTRSRRSSRTSASWTSATRTSGARRSPTCPGSSRAPAPGAGLGPRVPAPRRADPDPRPRRRRIVARPGVGLRRHPRGAPRPRPGAAREADARRVQQARPARGPRRVAGVRACPHEGGPRRSSRSPRPTGEGLATLRARLADLLPDASPSSPRRPSRPASSSTGSRRWATGSSSSAIEDGVVPGPRQAHRADRRPDQLRRRGVGRALPARPRPARDRRRAAAGRDRAPATSCGSARPSSSGRRSPGSGVTERRRRPSCPARSASSAARSTRSTSPTSRSPRRPATRWASSGSCSSRPASRRTSRAGRSPRPSTGWRWSSSRSRATRPSQSSRIELDRAGPVVHGRHARGAARSRRRPDLTL